MSIVCLDTFALHKLPVTVKWGVTGKIKNAQIQTFTYQQIGFYEERVGD